MFLPLATKSFLRKRIGHFDIIHIHSYRTFQNIVIRQHSVATGTPYVLSAHGSAPRIVRKRLAKSLFDSIIGRSILRDAARLVAVSGSELQQYRAMGVCSSKIAVIPNGIDASLYSLPPPKGAFARRHGLQGKKLVTYIGRLNARKGLDVLLESVRMLADTRDDFVLVLVGPDDGYLRQVKRITRRLSLQRYV